MFARIEEVRRFYPIVTTPKFNHSDGCWKTHINCCIHKLCDEIERIRTLECLRILEKNSILPPEIISDILDSLPPELVERIKNEH